MKKRNPHASVLTKPEFRPRVAKSAYDRAKQRDTFERGAKYRASPLDDFEDDIVEEDLQIGDNVEYVGDDEKLKKELKGKTGLVKNPLGPAGLVGTVFDGIFSLIPEDKLKIIEENLTQMRRLTEMKYVELTSGVRMPISSEEEEILKKVADGSIDKSSLDEREQEVARQMVNRGLLKRVKDSDKKIKFKKNKEKLGRD